MELVNIPTGNRPCVAHFPGPTREKDFQKWMAEQIKTEFIPTGMPTHLEIVCFASAGRLSTSPLIAQCAERGVPLTILGDHMTDAEYSRRSHFNKLYLLRDHILSGRAKPYILALDADDVLLCGSMRALDSAYNHHYDGKIVFGAESNLMYKMAQWNHYAIGDGADPHLEAVAIKKHSEAECRTFAEWKYLNGGMMIGQRDSLLLAIHDAISIAERVPEGVYKCDQSIWMWLWMQGKHNITLDFECRMFQNFNHALPWDFALDNPNDIAAKAARARSKHGKTDVVYLFHGSDTRDLFLSIRLLRKHGKNLGEIFVIGGEPGVMEGVNHIPFSDPGVKNKEANMTRKCLLAAHLSKITERFVLMSDDQFIMRDMDLAALPLRYKGDLERGRIETVYGQRTRETYLECLRLGLPTLNYNTHYPVPISGPQYIEALGLVPWDTEAGDGLLCRSIYGNYIGGGEFCVDAKGQARHAIAALDAPVISLPNNDKSLYGHIEAAAARI